jgi:uncharacterized MAPEG superfamily protein
MTMELKMLSWAVVLGLVHVLLAAALVTAQRGVSWNVGNRDREARPLTGFAARATRASGNFLETFAFFAAAVLAVVVAQKTTAGTALGAQIYLWARVAYLPVYVIGIPYLRTAVWAVGFWGLLQVIEGLF